MKSRHSPQERRVSLDAKKTVPTGRKDISTNLHKLARGLSACVALLLAGSAAAQSWPAKPIRFIVPYPPGGGADIVARLITPKLGESLGQPVLVDNKPGATTLIGTEMLAKAAPNGYTIGMITDSHSINPNFFPRLPYDSLKDFEPISQLIRGHFVLVANPALQLKSVRDLVAAAKARPGKLSYASQGLGGPHYLVMEWLKHLAGVDLNHIPYKGVAPAVLDVMAGHVDVMFTGSSSGLPQVNAGKLVGLAVSSAKRLASAPDIPTVAESGFPSLVYEFWYGMAAPAGTPKDVVIRLSREVAGAFAQPVAQARLAELGIEGAPSTPEEFTAFMQKEAAKYVQIIKITGAKGQ